MKRPQFGIRLMLLVVAFAASVFAWRRAERVLRWEQSGLARINADTELLLVEWSKLGDSEASRPDRFLVHPKSFITDGEQSVLEDDLRKLNANKP